MLSIFTVQYFTADDLSKINWAMRSDYLVLLLLMLVMLLLLRPAGRETPCDTKVAMVDESATSKLRLTELKLVFF